MARVRARVGVGGRNDPEDVKLVQLALARHTRWLGGRPAPAPTGRWDASSAAALTAFQREGAALKQPDGIVDPASYTMTALEKPVISGPAHRFFLQACWLHGPALTEADYLAAAKTIGSDVAAIKAVARVETKRAPWFEIERPTILFERHYFRDLTHGVYNRSHPDISGPQDYGAYGTYAEQYKKIKRAAMLDEETALKSASWGMFQIMGKNYTEAGFATVSLFVDSMMRGEQQHLSAFVSLISHSSKLKAALKNKEWAVFAAGYNGSGYRRDQYDRKMADAYAALSQSEKAEGSQNGATGMGVRR